MMMLVVFVFMLLDQDNAPMCGSRNRREGRDGERG
jgi:hypothetical protein